MRKVRGVRLLSKDSLNEKMMTNSFEDVSRFKKSLLQSLKTTEHFNLSQTKSPYLHQLPRRKKLPVRVKSLSKSNLLSNSMSLPKSDLSFTNYSTCKMPKNSDQELEFRSSAFSFCGHSKNESKGSNIEYVSTGLETQKNNFNDASLLEIIEMDFKLSQIIDSLLIVHKSKINAEDLIPILNILEKDTLTYKPMNSILNNMRRLLQYLCNEYLVRLKEMKHKNEQLQQRNSSMKTELSFEKHHTNQLEYKLDNLSKENLKLTQQHEKVLKEVKRLKTAHINNGSVTISEPGNEKLLEETYAKSEIIQHQKQEIQHLRQKELKLSRVLESLKPKAPNSKDLLSYPSRSAIQKSESRQGRRNIVPPLRIPGISPAKPKESLSSLSDENLIVEDFESHHKDSLIPALYLSQINCSDSDNSYTETQSATEDEISLYSP